MAPPTLDATVGGAASNVYALQAVATTYFSAHPQFDAIWTDAAVTSAIKDQWNITARRAVDSYQFDGEVEDSAQALEFPRNVQIGKDRFPETVIPTPVIESVWEMIRFLYHNSDTTTGLIGLTGIDVSELEVFRAVKLKFRGQGVNEKALQAAGGSLERVESLLAPWLTNVGTFPIVR